MCKMLACPGFGTAICLVFSKFMSSGESVLFLPFLGMLLLVRLCIPSDLWRRFSSFFAPSFSPHFLKLNDYCILMSSYLEKAEALKSWNQ